MRRSGSEPRRALWGSSWFGSPCGLGFARKVRRGVATALVATTVLAVTCFVVWCIDGFSLSPQVSLLQPGARRLPSPYGFSLLGVRGLLLGSFVFPLSGAVCVAAFALEAREVVVFCREL